MKYYRMKNGIGVESKVDYIMREEDKALIPCTEENPDYRAYLADKDKEVEDFDYAAEAQRQVVEGQRLAQEKAQEDLIQARIREIAVRELRQEGKIPQA
jgi:hypothetical protein